MRNGGLAARFYIVDGRSLSCLTGIGGSRAGLQPLHPVS
jgi:hypothetical protein